MENIKITAKTTEDFNKIESEIKSLPEQIWNQIENAEFGAVGIMCTIRDKFEDRQRIFLPNKVTQISDFDDYIGIYCDNLFFKLTGNLYKRKNTLIFIESA